MNIDIDSMDDFGSEFAQTYTNVCAKCGKVFELSTQQDDMPEYYTRIYIRCECGDSVKFVLPVN